MLLGYSNSKAIDNVGEMTSVAGTRNAFQDNCCFVCDRALSHQNEPYAVRLAVRYELPFGHDKKLFQSGPAAVAFGGWSLGAFYTVDSGGPVAVSSPNNSNSLGGGTGTRPDTTGQSAAHQRTADLRQLPVLQSSCVHANAAVRFRQCAPLPAECQQPDGCQRGRVDREVHAGPRAVQPGIFRAEMFNQTNHVVFAGPTTSIRSATFGKIILSQSNAPRQVQFSLRLRF